MKVANKNFYSQLPSQENENTIIQNYTSGKVFPDFPVIVLDDDPTGIQTVHGVPVYMTWEKNTIKSIFNQKELAFIHTNTRAYKPDKVKRILGEIMENVIAVSKKNGQDFEIICRGDSTIRGHYPLETDYIREIIEKETNKKIDGEIICPFFKEGGRVTANDIHYVKEGENYTPASETEFAKDPDFGYKNSDLKKWIEEKTLGQYKSEDVIPISLDLLRQGKKDEIITRLNQAENFAKIIVNAVEYTDLMAFIPALLDVQARGKKYLFRTAASFVKIYGFVEDKELLTGLDLGIKASKSKSILLIAGSYTGKTSSQLDKLMKEHEVVPIEIKVKNVLGGEKGFHKEVTDRIAETDKLIAAGKNPVLFTSRELVKTADHLQTAETISSALINIVNSLKNRPAMVIAKGGITSSVIGVQGLKIAKAMVEGQIIPGVPVIVAGDESKWPGIPYVIFPGNVGNENSLSELYSRVLLD